MFISEIFDDPFNKNTVTEMDKRDEWYKLPSGDYMNLHTGVKSSKRGQNLGEPSDTEKKDHYQKELDRLKANPNSHKSHIRRAEQMVRRYSR